MMLNKPSGNMYPWSWTWNPLGGVCLHGCRYCYVTHKIAPKLHKMGNDKYLSKPHLLEKELKTSLKKPDDGRVIFVESCGDIGGNWWSDETVIKILNHCKEYPENTYLFQSKSPGRFFTLLDDMPPKFIIGTTIETDQPFNCTLSPPPMWCRPPPDQHRRLAVIQSLGSRGCHTMISIEPILDFELDPFIKLIHFANPDFVSIGGDSCNCNLIEPSPEKTKIFIEELRKFTEVRIKGNVNRILEGI